MDQHDTRDDDRTALSALSEIIAAASVPEHLKREPNLAFLTQEQLAERWGLSIDTLREYRSKGGGPPFFGGRIRGREVKYPTDGVLEYETLNRVEFNGQVLPRR